MKFFEKPIKQQLKFQGLLVNVRHDMVTIENESFTTYREVVEHPGGVCIAALTERNTFLLVEQYRYAQKETTIEFVAGKKEPTERPEMTALRELEEETGYIAQEIEYLGEVYPSPAYLDESISLYFARDLKQSVQQLDDGEFLRVEEMKLESLIQKIETNQIKDLKTIALAYRLQSRGF